MQIMLSGQQPTFSNQPQKSSPLPVTASNDCYTATHKRAANLHFGMAVTFDDLDPLYKQASQARKRIEDLILEIQSSLIATQHQSINTGDEWSPLSKISREEFEAFKQETYAEFFPDGELESVAHPLFVKFYRDNPRKALLSGINWKIEQEYKKISVQLSETLQQEATELRDAAKKLLNELHTLPDNQKLCRITQPRMPFFARFRSPDTVDKIKAQMEQRTQELEAQIASIEERSNQLLLKYMDTADPLIEQADKRKKQFVVEFCQNARGVIDSKKELVEILGVKPSLPLKQMREQIEIFKFEALFEKNYPHEKIQKLQELLKRLEVRSEAYGVRI